jgi:L,D-peptidoglycan transpeptidase YkuD (ErfK/YbiS/YcfS/YnhG family)
MLDLLARLAVAWLAVFESTLASQQIGSPIPAESRQMILSVSADWSATTARLQAYERRSPGDAWVAVGEPIDASLGRTGLAWGRGLHPAGLAGPEKREGDGKSPAGVFDLRLVTGYGAAAPAGTRLPYREATATLRCVDDVRSRYYNQLVDEAALVRDWSSAEDMRLGSDVYRLVIWVGHNDAPVVPGAGSCIFLHLRTGPGSVTAGCTAFESGAMERLLRWLDPRKRPVLVQLPQAEQTARAREWGLPDGELP